MSHSSPITNQLPNASKPTGLAPIVLFVHKRKELAEKTVDALRQNALAPESDLFVISDGAKSEPGAAAVQQVRTYIHTIKGFRSVTIIERDRNWGLANSVISGITQLCNEFGRVICMEDDLLTTPDFLTFMNQALMRYESEPRVYSISGFNFGFQGPHHYPYDAIYFYRSSSLGWATWKDRWGRADWNMSDFSSFCADKMQQQKFGRGGEDLCRMLAMQMQGMSDSWAIRWAYTHFKQDALAVLSYLPRVLHIGSEWNATHSRWKSFKQLPLTAELKPEFRFPENVKLVESFVLELQRSLRPPLARKVARYLLHGRIRLTCYAHDSEKSSLLKTEKPGVLDPRRRSLGD